MAILGELQPFYPRDTSYIKGTRIVQADGYAAKGERAVPFNGVQIATRNPRTGERAVLRNFRGNVLDGIILYESHRRGFTKDGRPTAYPRYLGEWISQGDYDRLTQK